MLNVGNLGHYVINLITSFHLQTKIHPLESVALDVNEKICMEDH